jgi:hypothetical protein
MTLRELSTTDQKVGSSSLSGCDVDIKQFTSIFAGVGNYTLAPSLHFFGGHIFTLDSS